jgi:hypothetical protein
MAEIWGRAMGWGLESLTAEGSHTPDSCADQEATDQLADDALLGAYLYVSLAIGLLACRLLAAGWLRFLQSVHASNAGADKRQNVTVEGRPLDILPLKARGMRAYQATGKGKAFHDAVAAEERLHSPSEVRLQELNAQFARDVAGMLSPSTIGLNGGTTHDVALGEVVSDDEEEVIDVRKIRQQAEESLCLGKSSRPRSQAGFHRDFHQRGVCREGFVSARPLRFSSKFDRRVQNDPTGYWLAKYALLHPEKFDKLVVETELESPSQVPDLCPLHHPAP